MLLGLGNSFLKIFLFIYFWLRWSSLPSGGFSLVVYGPLIVMASLVVEHGF